MWLWNQLVYEEIPLHDEWGNYRNFNFTNGNLENVWLRGFYEEYTRTPQGDVATKKDGRGNTWEYQNYLRGLPQLERRPDSTSATRAVNAHGLVDSETNGRNNTTGYTYDNMNRVTGIDRPLGTDVSVEWGTGASFGGTFKRIVTRGSYKETTQYDGFGLVTCVDTTDGFDHVTQLFRYNALGHKVYESYPFSGNCSASVLPAGDSFITDALGRVTKVTHADQTFRTYDFAAPGSNKVKLTDERGKVTTYEYRSYGDPDKERLLMSVDAPENVRTAFERNLIGQVTSVTQGTYYEGSCAVGGCPFTSETRTYEYNHVQNFLTGETNPETGTTSYGRDGVGNMTSRNVGGATTAYGYDPLNRLKVVDYPLGTPDASLDYDENGNLKRLYTATGRNYADGSRRTYSTERLFSYDANDNLTRESLKYNDAGTSAAGVPTVFESKLLESRYGYNTLDALTSITYPSTRVVTFAPDALGRPTRVAPFVNSVNYHPTGQPSSIDYANGQRTTVDLKTGSLRPWIDRIRTGSLSSLSYDYDDAGNVTRIADGINPTYTQSMDYDGLNRLTTANGNWGSGRITYDAIGNIKSKNLGTQNLSYNYDGSNRLTSVTGARNYSFGYDRYGNAITNGANLFTYDDASNLTTVSGGPVMNYWYDGKNMRVREQKGTTTKYFFYASNGSLLGEYDRNGSLYKEYAYLGSKLVAMADTSSYPPVANAGSVQTVIEGTSVTLSGSGTDADGSVVAYSWTQVAGPAVTLTNPNTATASFVAPLVSPSTVLTFQLAVTDNEGLTGTATVNVTVQHINIPPTVSAGFDQFVDAGTGVTLIGSGSDPDGTTVTFAWTQLSGSPVTLRGANTATPIFNAPYVLADSVLTFQLNVRDASGAVSSATVNVTVRVVATPNQLPTVTVTQGLVIAEGQPVTLTSTALDPETGPLTYQWTQLSGPSVVLSSPNALTTSFVAPYVAADTVFTFELLVKDNTYAFAADMADVTVSNVTAPRSITGIPGIGQANISWRPIDGATTYNLYWGTASGVTPASGNRIQNVTSPYVHAGLTNGATYYYILTAANTEGETLPSAEVYVTPGVEGWGARTVVDDRMNYYSSPQVTMDGAGNTFFTWNREGTNGYYQANIMRFSPDTGWGPIQVLNDPSVSYAADTGQVVANDTGIALALWSQAGSEPGIWARRFDPLAGWEPPVRVSLPGHSAFVGDAAINASGNAVTVWCEWIDNVGWQEWTSFYAPGSGWGAPEFNNNIHSCQKRVAMNVAGDIAVQDVQAAVKADGAAGMDILVRLHTTGGGWGTPMMVSDGQGLVSGSSEKLSIDDAGNVVVVWTAKDGLDVPPVCNPATETCDEGLTYPSSVWARRYTPATGWTPSVLLETMNSDVTEVQIAANNSGNLIATWQQGDGQRAVFAAHYTPSAGWSVAQQIGSSGTGGANTSFSAPVVMDRYGNATAVWTEANTALPVYSYENSIVVGRYRPALGWITQQIEPSVDFQYSTTPSLALDSHGNVTAVWERATWLPLPESKWSYSVVANRYSVNGSGTSPNQPPTASAGTTQTVNEGTAVTLTGTGADSDGTIASYAWTQTAGTPVTLANANTAVASFTAPQVTANTVLTFQLTVTDNGGATAGAMVNVTVNDVPVANDPPTAKAGANQTVNEGAAATLTGSGSDSDGTIASYAWTQTVGPAVTLTNANTVVASFTAPQVTANTVLTFQLTVTDNGGATASATVNVTVNDVPISNVPPTANAGTVQTANEGTAVALTGSGTDTDGTIASYAWTQTAGPAVILTNANTTVASFTAPAVSVDTVLTFQLTVTDNLGATGTATASVTVANVNQLPTANAGANQFVNEGSPVTLTGTGTDADGTIASYAWTQTAGPAVTLATPNAASTTFTAPQVAADTVLTFQLTATDNQGATAAASVNVTVRVVSVTGVDLTANTLTASKTTANAGEVISVSASIVNQGASPTATGSYHRFVLSSDATIDASDTVLKEVFTGVLAAGASATVNTTVTIPANLASGNYTLGVIVDASNSETETNETNNAVAGPALSVQ